jgi:hypothetical protein
VPKALKVLADPVLLRSDPQHRGEAAGIVEGYGQGARTDSRGRQGRSTSPAGSGRAAPASERPSRPATSTGTATTTTSSPSRRARRAPGRSTARTAPSPRPSNWSAKAAR